MDFAPVCKRKLAMCLLHEWIVNVQRAITALLLHVLEVWICRPTAGISLPVIGIVMIAVILLCTAILMLIL